MYIWHTAASSNINILYFTCLYFQTLYITESVEVISLFFPVSLGTNFPLSKLPLWIRYLNLQILYTHTYTHTHTHTHTHIYIYIHTHTHTHIYSDGKKSAFNEGKLGSIPRLGRSPGEENGYTFQYSGLENFMDIRAWWATVHRVAKSWTWLSD